MTRTRFDAQSLAILKEVFARDQTPSSRTRLELAAQFDVTPRAIQVWFQNQRQRQKAARMHAARTLNFAAHSGLPMQRSVSTDREISAEMLTQLRRIPEPVDTIDVDATPTQVQVMQADSDARTDSTCSPQRNYTVGVPPPMIIQTQAFYGRGMYCGGAAPIARNNTVDSLADLAEVAGMSKLLDKSDSFFHLASLSRNGSLADLASLSRSGSLKDLSTLSRNGSSKDLAAVNRGGSLVELARACS